METIKNDAARGYSVDDRRPDLPVAVAAEVVGAMLIRHEQEKVG